MEKANKLLSIKNLNVTYKDSFDYTALKDFCLDVYEKDSIGIVGESGSGKTTVAMSLMRLIDSQATTHGEIEYQSDSIMKYNDVKLSEYRGIQVGFCPQNSLEALNPLMTIEEQITEGIKRHFDYDSVTIKGKVESLFEKVGLSNDFMKAYPHQLSGGMRQKVLIAIAISLNPKILLVDEPTSSLDIDSRIEIVNLLRLLKEENEIALIVISHDMEVIAQLCDRCALLYQGELVESGITKEIFSYPEHPYTRGLISASLEVNPYQDLWGIPGEIGLHDVPGCSFYSRCTQRTTKCKFEKPKLLSISSGRLVACNRGGIVKVLKAKELNKTYNIGKKKIKACVNANIELRAGEIVSIVGPSGSGKTTLVSMLCGILEKDKGEIEVFDEILNTLNMHRSFHGMQMVFQDPYSSINGDFTIEKAVSEPLIINKLCSKDESYIYVKKALVDVGLSDEDCFLKTRTGSLSGGQRQRVAIARAMVMKPKILIADEISSMLDPSTKANVLRLMKELQNKNGFSMIYVTHDLQLARKISNRIYEVDAGQVNEKTICFL
ncbi:ABC transporter ATP-binding protein [Acetoanaerobium sticklandii]|uniref:ABC transporter ATP-binding protein n=1 Tax=Acetoanaerobium sticklandii TaxID=1511 RepID=UPI003A8FBB9E